VSSPFRPSGAECSAAQWRNAWLVHLFTTLGIVAAMLAMRDILVGRPDYAIIWLLVTLLIDGVDGPIARALEVERRVPLIDGFLLDLIIDYVTCVVVPAAFMYEFKVVPQNNWGIAVLCVMVFTSAIWFARKDMMSEDMFLMEARTAVGAVITLILSVLCLTNIPFPHIARARFMRPFTAVATVVWIGGIVAGTFAYPSHPHYVRVLLYLGGAYFVVLSGIRWWYERSHRAPAGTPAGNASAAETR
jgi:phosphatidylcholine synthase